MDLTHVPDDLVFELRPEEIERQLVALTLIRAAHSKRRVLERMVHVWSDHFHIAIGKSLCQHLLAVHERRVLRPSALGTFRELLRAVVLSPAMLVYLDGRDNDAGPGHIANENHARELLELHTLGVDGGYSQHDIMDAARALSGWTVSEEGAPGSVSFDASRHDDGEKWVLGRRIPAGGGAADVERLLDIVLAHPSCARFVARSLAVSLVADDPPAALVDRVASTFTQSGGSIPAMLRTLLLAEELDAAPARRITRPLHYVVAAARALDAEVHAYGDTARALEAMGHAPFQYPTPDGYPREGSVWTGTLLARWRFAAALAADELDDVRVDLASLESRLVEPGGAIEPARALAHLTGRAPLPSELEPLEVYHARSAGLAPGVRRARLFALALSSPAFVCTG